MIKKLWCLIWGCKVSHDVFTGRYGMVHDCFGFQKQVPVVRKTRLDFCPRCGKVHK